MNILLRQHWSWLSPQILEKHQCLCCFRVLYTWSFPASWYVSLPCNTHTCTGTHTHTCTHVPSLFFCLANFFRSHLNSFLGSVLWCPDLAWSSLYAPWPLHVLLEMCITLVLCTRQRAWLDTDRWRLWLCLTHQHPQHLALGQALNNCLIHICWMNAQIIYLLYFHTRRQGLRDMQQPAQGHPAGEKDSCQAWDSELTIKHQQALKRLQSSVERCRGWEERAWNPSGIPNTYKWGKKLNSCWKRSLFSTLPSHLIPTLSLSPGVTFHSDPPDPSLSNDNSLRAPLFPTSAYFSPYTIWHIPMYLTGCVWSAWRHWGVSSVGVGMLSGLFTAVSPVPKTVPDT